MLKIKPKTKMLTISMLSMCMGTVTMLSGLFFFGLGNEMHQLCFILAGFVLLVTGFHHTNRIVVDAGDHFLFVLARKFAPGQNSFFNEKVLLAGIGIIAVGMLFAMAFFASAHSLEDMIMPSVAMAAMFPLLAIKTRLLNRLKLYRSMSDETLT